MVAEYKIPNIDLITEFPLLFPGRLSCVLIKATCNSRKCSLVWLRATCNLFHALLRTYSPLHRCVGLRSRPHLLTQHASFKNRLSDLATQHPHAHIHRQEVPPQFGNWLPPKVFLVNWALISNDLIQNQIILSSKFAIHLQSVCNRCEYKKKKLENPRAIPCKDAVTACRKSRIWTGNRYSERKDVAHIHTIRFWLPNPSRKVV